jgi:hypothetical protein
MGAELARGLRSLQVSLGYSERLDGLEPLPV